MRLAGAISLQETNIVLYSGSPEMTYRGVRDLKRAINNNNNSKNNWLHRLQSGEFSEQPEDEKAASSLLLLLLLLYCIDRCIYLNLSKSTRNAAGLKALKPAANGRYLMCKSLSCYFQLLYRSKFIFLSAKSVLGLFVFPFVCFIA